MPVEVEPVSFAQRVDRYLRRSDTQLAKGLKTISPTTPEDYRGSLYKRGLDLAVSIPAFAIAAPIIATLGVAVKLEDGGPMLYRQERQGRDAPMLLVKIRTMKRGSDSEEAFKNAHGRPAWENPNNTRFGSYIRKFDLDELPQLWQILKGKFSLIGIRPLWKPSLDHIKDNWTEEKYSRWLQLYKNTSLGLAGVEELVGPRMKQDENRYHNDAFYAKHESLGLDLYLAWRMFAKFTRILK